MFAYRQYLTITDPDRLEIGKVPFKAGQRVQIVILAEEPQAMDIEPMRSLFAETQALPHFQDITDEDIAREIADYRAGR
jgi:antitoxin ParD1/3/4